jgi:hypothetical protein
MYIYIYIYCNIYIYYNIYIYITYIYTYNIHIYIAYTYICIKHSRVESSNIYVCTGTVSLTQIKFIPVTQLSVNLKGLNFEPDFYHIHMNPVANGCGVNGTAGHLNPYKVDPTKCKDGKNVWEKMVSELLDLYLCIFMLYLNIYIHVLYICILCIGMIIYTS